MNMKKALIFGSVAVLLYLLIRPSPEPTMLEIVQSYEEQWGIELPEPQRFEHIWATKFAARGDGEWYSVMHYDGILPEPSDVQFTKITAQNNAVISGKVNRFMTDTIHTHLGDEETQAEIRSAFDKQPVEFSNGDFYFHIAKKGGNDYLVGIYSPLQKKIYLLEWTQ